MQWIEVYRSKYPNKGTLKCKCDKCGHMVFGDFKDYRFGTTLHYELPKFCEECGDKKTNTYIYDED